MISLSEQPVRISQITSGIFVVSASACTLQSFMADLYKLLILMLTAGNYICPLLCVPLSCSKQQQKIGNIAAFCKVEVDVHLSLGDGVLKAPEPGMSESAVWAFTLDDFFHLCAFL